MTTKLEKVANEYAFRTGYNHGTVSWQIRQAAYLNGLKKGVALSLEAMEAITCGLSIPQNEGLTAAYHAVSALATEDGP